MSNNQNLLVGSDGALYCKVRPAPTIYDVDTGRVENASNMRMMSPYFQQMPSSMPVVLDSSSLNMVGNPYQQMGSFHPGFQGPGMAVMPDMSYSAVPGLSTMGVGHAPVLNAAQGRAEGLAAASALFNQEERASSLLEPSAKRMRLMSQTGVQGVMPGAGGVFQGMQAGLAQNLETKPRVVGRVFPLYLKSDDFNLSHFQRLARKQIEIFEATEEDAGTTAQGRNKPIIPGQVGIRCIHCAKLPRRERKTGAVYYPNKLDGIYQTGQKMTMGHFLKHCTQIPKETREKLQYYKDQKSSDGGGKRYWGDGAQSLGVYETPRDGLAFKADSAASPEDS